MSKRGKGRSGRRRPATQRQTSSLQQHRRQGKLLQPPFRTIGNLTQVPWLRDSFPDMLWICTQLVQQDGHEGMLAAAKFLDCIDEVLDSSVVDGHAARPENFVLTGELSKFDQIPVTIRGDVISELRRRGLYDEGFPWALVRALDKYSSVPGSWLADGWESRAQVIPADEPEKLLAKVVSAANHGQSVVATRAKAMILRAWLHAGKMSLTPAVGQEWADILPRYPDRITEEERRRIEPSIRATWLALANGGDPQLAAATDTVALAWAKRFWRENWSLYKCRSSESESGPADDDTSDVFQTVKQAREEWDGRARRLQEEFLSAATSADPDLYVPDRHEVLSGITYRMLRSATMLVNSPRLWSMEYGAAMLRSVIEALIVLKWLIKQDDPALYERFKNYGRGRVKLLKLHLEEYRDTLDEVSEDLDDQIKYLEALVNQDIWEEFQDISIEGSFSGIDTRRMAEQVDLMTEYRLLFAPASANVHGEWGPIDQYALDVCRNPLHRWHRVPRDEVGISLGPGLVETVLEFLGRLVDTYKSAIVAEPRSEAAPEGGH